MGDRLVLRNSAPSNIGDAHRMQNACANHPKFVASPAFNPRELFVQKP
jgi:hypothetical protein